MTFLLQEWLEVILRWFHVIAGIAWIGSSFYFIALDLSLKQNKSLMFNQAFIIIFGLPTKKTLKIIEHWK